MLHWLTSERICVLGIKVMDEICLVATKKSRSITLLQIVLKSSFLYSLYWTFNIMKSALMTSFNKWLLARLHLMRNTNFRLSLVCSFCSILIRIHIPLRVTWFSNPLIHTILHYVNFLIFRINLNAFIINTYVLEYSQKWTNI